MGAATTTTTILLALSGCVSAFPSTTDRNNTGVEPAWVSDPVGRGTFGLLLSCVLTLGLCVWTG